MNAAERIEAVRLSLEVIDLRRQRRITIEQARALIETLGLPVAVLDPSDVSTGPLTPRPMVTPPVSSGVDQQKAGA